MKTGELMSDNILVKKKKGLSLGENKVFLLISMPFMILFFVFNILPVLSSIVLSFFDYDMVSSPIFIGVENFGRMFAGDDTFLKVLGNTLKFSIIAGPGGFILAFILAWMINEFSRTVRVILTFIFYAPALVGNAYFVWQIFFSGDSLGYLNNLLISFGFITEPINWFQNINYNMTILIIIQLWMSMGVTFLSNIAGLQNVDSELYEAGAIDGIKTRWHELWYITLPSMKSILLFGAVMQIQSVFSVSGLMTTLVGYPSVNNSVDTLVSYISDIGTARYEMGYASALSVVLFLLVLAFRYGIGAFLNLIGKKDN